MDKHERLILAAASIAGGMAAAAYEPSKGITQPVMEHIAQLAITIARRISEEATKYPLK